MIRGGHAVEGPVEGTREEEMRPLRRSLAESFARSFAGSLAGSLAGAFAGAFAVRRRAQSVAGNGSRRGIVALHRAASAAGDCRETPDLNVVTTRRRSRRSARSSHA
jgi:hypothetical protein